MDLSTINISGGISWICSVALFVVSLLYCYRKGCPQYLRSFPIYCLGNLLPELLVVLHIAPANIANFAYTIFELTYFSYFLSKVIRRRGFLVILWGLDTFYFLYIAHLIIKYRRVGIGDPEIGEAFILILASLIYYILIFTERSTLPLNRTPSFWIVTGILFYMVLFFPTLLMYGYYFTIHKFQVAALYYWVNSVAVTAAYFLYAKGMLCWKKT